MRGKRRRGRYDRPRSTRGEGSTRPLYRFGVTEGSRRGFRGTERRGGRGWGAARGWGRFRRWGNGSIPFFWKAAGFLVVRGKTQPRDRTEGGEQPWNGREVTRARRRLTCKKILVPPGSGSGGRGREGEWQRGRVRRGQSRTGQQYVWRRFWRRPRGGAGSTSPASGSSSAASHTTPASPSSPSSESSPAASM